MQIDKCLAPDCNQDRVSNHHCLQHSNQFKPKYLNYKHLQSLLPRLDNLDQLTTTDLLSLYNKYAKVYKLRRLCMRKFFDLKHWDIGHNLMAADLFANLIKIEKFIGISYKNNIIINDIKLEQEEEDIEDEQHVIELEQIQTVSKTFSIWELLDNPDTCLAKAYKQELINKDRVIKTFWSLLLDGIKAHTDMDIKKCNIDLADQVLSFIWQAQVLANRKHNGENNVQTVYSFTKLPSCCLKHLLQIYITNNNNTNTNKIYLIHLVTEIIKVITTFKTSQISMGYNIHCHPESRVLTRNGWIPFSEMGLVDYFSCRHRERGLYTNFAILFVDFIPVFNLKHQHLSSCQFCYQEIDQGLQFGSLHVK